MYSEQLEQLIRSVIADHKITKNERAVLHKKAEAEGVDIDELDVYVDGLMAQSSPVVSQLTQPVIPKSPTKHGVVVKCPNCGAIVEAGAVKCEACGYIFRGVEANSSSKKLHEIMAKIDEAYRDKKNSHILSNDVDHKHYMEKVTAIQTFPVPTTKEDLWEFAITMKSMYENQSFGGLVDPLKAAYKAKYNECITKAKVMFANDPQFQPLFMEHKKANQGWNRLNQLNGTTKACLLLLIILLMPFIILIIMLICD